MNDIAHVTDKFHSVLYADDTSLTEPLCTFNADLDNTSSSVSDAINKELSLITDWLALNKLSLNAKKTKMMVFHHRQRNISAIIPKLRINDSKIERVKEFNFLGIVLDECLTWKSHIQKIASKIARVIGTLNRLKRFLPCDILKMIYNALIQPHINYGILLWGLKAKRIIKLQKWAIRAITCSKYNAHTDPVLKRLLILKVSDIYNLTALKFYHKYKMDKLPKSFHDLLKPIQINHTHHTRHRNITRFPIPKTVLGKSTIRFTIPELLKDMPSCIIDKLSTHSLEGFAYYTKKLMINEYKEVCEIRNCYICNIP